MNNMRMALPRNFFGRQGKELEVVVIVLRRELFDVA